MFPFENLEVYKKAFNLNSRVYVLIKGNKSIPAYLRDQLGRASLSVMLNIAEGSGKFSFRDRRSFFVIARGSAFESAAIISFLHTQNEISQEECIALKNEYEEISRILYSMIKNLETKQENQVKP